MKKKKVLVVGNGAIGSMIMEALTRNSTGIIVGVDKDSYEAGNIPKSSLTIRYPEDIGFNKAEVLAKRLSAIANDGCELYGFDMDLKKIGSYALSCFDYVVLALDNTAMKIFAASILKQCPKDSRPICLSCGTNGEYSEAMIFTDTGACLRCTIPDSWLESEDPETVWSCASKVNYLLPEKVAPIVSTSGIASGKAALDIDDMITAHATGAKGFKDSERFSQMGYPGKDGHSSIIMPMKKCPVCKIKPPENITEFEGSTTKTTLRELLKSIKDKYGVEYSLRVHSLTIPAIIPKTYNQYVISGVCRSCGKEFRLYKHTGFIRDDEIICPDCKNRKTVIKQSSEREDYAVNTFSLDDTPDDVLDMKLFDLGYPIGAYYEAEELIVDENEDVNPEELFADTDITIEFPKSKIIVLKDDKDYLISEPSASSVAIKERHKKNQIQN